ncbi:hypothetical protein OAK17_02995 [Alphaproteobacteria bacterium]|nr:hypothetical protein [Alphaproteobacteria bacterium]
MDAGLGGPDGGGDAGFLAGIFAGGDGVGDNIFADALRGGGTVDDAFQAVGDFNRPGEGGDFRNFDFIDNPFNAGFDPFLQVQIQLEEIFNTLEIEANIAEDTVSQDIFDESIEGTINDDNLLGSTRNTNFTFTQGTTFGGNDTITDEGGTDQITFANLSDIMLLFDAATRTMTYSNSSSSITGSAVIGAEVEQIFVSDTSLTSQVLAFPTDQSGTGVIRVGSSGSDNIDMSTSAHTVGSLTQNMSNIFGVMLFGDSGDDILVGSASQDIVRGGSGDDTFTLTSGGDALLGETGNDTFIISTPTLLRGDGASISGGDGSDTIVLGTASSTSGLTFSLTNAQIASIEILNIIPASVIVTGFSTTFSALSTINTTSTGSAITSLDDNLNLAAVSIGSGVSTLNATGSLGVRIFDGSDSTGRTINGTNFGDVLSGAGGADTFNIGGGSDTVTGGTGNDIINITSNSDLEVADRNEFSGGDGTDTVKVTSSGVSSIGLSESSAFTTLESIDLSEGSSSGVTFSINFANQIDNASGVTIKGTSSTVDTLVIRSDGFELSGRTAFDNMEILSLTKSTAANVAFSSDTTFSNVAASVFSITGSSLGTGFHNLSLVKNDLNASSTSNVDFSKISLAGSLTDATVLSNVQLNARADESASTIDFSSSTNFGTAPVLLSFGTGGDVLNYTSVLNDGQDGLLNEDLDVKTISNGSGTNVLTDLGRQEIGFFTGNNLKDGSGNDLRLDGSVSETALLASVESLLEDFTGDVANPIVGASQSVSAASPEEHHLLVFKSGASSTAQLMIRYIEGSVKDDDFGGELSLVGIFDGGDIVDSNIT